MENIEQENIQEAQQIQLVLPKEAEDEIARLEKQYRETIERENNGSI